MKIFCGLLFALFWTRVPAWATPLINAWTNPASGNWEDLHWSLGVLPGPGQTIVITNQGWKAVAIAPNTVRNSPETLDVNSVILGGYTDSFNVLLLNFAGFETPLTTSSMNVRTNSGVTALASILNVSKNSGSGALSIFSVFNQGEEAIVNAHAISLGDVTNAQAGAGEYNETNGTITADEISGWSGSVFNQFDGTNTIDGALSLGGGDAANTGHYRIAGGALKAASIELQRGDFNQIGGSVSAALDMGAATYTLAAGTLRLPGITIPKALYGPQNPYGFLDAKATLLQTGGTNFCDGSMLVYHEYGAPGVGVPFLGPGSYVLSNGVLCVSGNLRAYLGSYEQWGGWQTNAGTEVDGDVFPNYAVRTGTLTLGGGTLITPSISVNLGDFNQFGGTNQVNGDVGVGTTKSPATFRLSDGLLTDENTSVEASHPAVPGAQQALFIQYSGTHLITNLLRVTGPPTMLQVPDSLASYALDDGQLIVPNIQLDSVAFFDHEGGKLLSSGLLNLGVATWYEHTHGQQFGQLLLSAPAGSNANFWLPQDQDCIIHFADSSSVAWSNQATLFINNWNGSVKGGGQHQVFFGSSASGLTPQQISQIFFRDPAGEHGILPARILSTGEVIPERFLAAQEASTNLLIQWTSGTLQSATNVTGPYEDVSNTGTNSYTAPFTEPALFFHVRR